ncbi:MAG: hypothetical protein KAW40_03715 [Candidatus Aenigmarchaeota archaeon]|nr:hypothetical protein [Candidatus Aenigmarchaeota archaeon]
MDYEISLKSTQNAICAVGSSFLERQWEGGLECNWGEPETGGSEATGRITGNVPAEIVDTGSVSPGEDKELDISEVRKLQPSVDCGTDETGKYTCTVKNFIMPQKVTKWEEHIPYWGDPAYLMYWNSFPTEEDTWNFRVSWVHHVVIAAIAILPVTKSVAVGFKTFWTALKGPGKKAVASKAAQTIFKQSTKGLSDDALYKVMLNQKALGKVDEKLLLEAINNLGTDITEETAERYGKEILSKLSKKELKEILGQAGVKYGRVAALKDVMLKGTIDILKKRVNRMGIVHAAIMGGKFLSMEAALAALADSIMKKYEPVGNAIAIKNPGNESGDIKTFELPEEMEHVPVLVKWEPVKGDVILKNAYFASPCYLEEFSVSKENIVCEKYMKGGDGKSVVCEGGGVADISDENYVCGKVNWWSITSHTREDMGNVIKGLIDNDEKKLFEISDIYKRGELEKILEGVYSLSIDKLREMKEKDGIDVFDKHPKWELEKIYLPWLSTSYFSYLVPQEQYYLENIEFMGGTLKRGYTSRGVTDIERSVGIQIGEVIKNYLPNWEQRGGVGYTEIYDSKLRCGEDCYFLLTGGSKDEVIMSSGKEYLLDLNPSKGGVDVSVYDVEKCKEVSGFHEGEKGFGGITECDVVKEIVERIKAGNGKMNVSVVGGGLLYEMDVIGITAYSQLSKIRNTIDIVTELTDDPIKRKFYNLRIVPKDDIKAGDLDYYDGEYLGSFLDCKDEGMGEKRVCVRTFQDAINLPQKIICRGTGGDETISFSNNIAPMSCDIELPKPFENPFYGGEEEVENIALSMYFQLDEDGKVIDKTYSSLTFRTGEKIFVQFGDDEEDGYWDQISVERGPTLLEKIAPDCMFGKSENKFKIKISDIGIDGSKNKDYEAYSLYMENCKTDAVVISFEGDSPNKMKTESSNYCLRSTKGFTRFLSANYCGISVGNVISAALFVVTLVTTDGGAAVLLLASAATEAYSEISEETQQMWP